MVFDDRPGVWSASNIADLRRRFNDERLEGGEGGGTFDSKWDHQMSTASEDVRLLAAELLLVHFLFPSSVGASKKLEVIARSLDGLELPDDATPVQAMSQWIGNPGVGFNTRRDLQVSYLIDFVERFKALEPGAGAALLESPWELRDFADDTSWPVREMRHVLLHLLRPDEFERISSGTHKREIASVLSVMLDDAPADLDEQLLAIRSQLEPLMPKGNTKSGLMDFYYPPLRGIWEAGGGDGDDAGDLESLEWKKQLVLYGPPGTGKTYVATLLAEQLIRRAALKQWGPRSFFERQSDVDRLIANNILRLQLHPGYGYEHFIRGLRLEGDSTVYRPGALPNFVDTLAKQDVPDGLTPLPGVLLLDEINRTDLSAMLGEAFSLLEAGQRGKELELPGFDEGQAPSRLVIPEELFVIGTMNEIDQSVETLDFALRRRFLWRLCGFDRSSLLDIVRGRWERDVPRWGHEHAAQQLEVFADRAQQLNDEIASSPELGSQYEIGHTYFADVTFFLGVWARGRSSRPPNGTWLWTKDGRPQQALTGLWDRSLGPLLAQYLSGSDVRESEHARLREVLTAGP